jgi:hypothetical protein
MKKQLMDRGEYKLPSAMVLELARLTEAMEFPSGMEGFRWPPPCEMKF